MGGGAVDIKVYHALNLVRCNSGKLHSRGYMQNVCLFVCAWLHPCDFGPVPS